MSAKEELLKAMDELIAKTKELPDAYLNMADAFQKLRNSAADQELSADFLQNLTMLTNEFVGEAKKTMLRLFQLSLTIAMEVLKQSGAKLKETA